MKALLYLFCLSPLAGAAVSACSGDGLATQWSDGMPPERYRKPTVATVFFIPLDRIAETCGVKPPPGIRIVGCHGGGIIVLPDPCPYGEAGEYFARITCHEASHRVGWPGDHPE